MEPVEQLQQIVAQLCGAQASEIGSGFSLKSRGLQSSVRRAALAAAVRRQFSVSCTEIYSVGTFGELQAAVFGNGSKSSAVEAKVRTPVKQAAGPEALAVDDLACGIDLEMINALPVADDYWEHEFYQQTFSSDEIAYCVVQDNSRMHFAGRWCAKEALIKCDSTFKGETLANLEVTRNASGEISMTHRVDGVSRKLPVAVSISHTDTMAVAVVVGRRHSR